VFKTTIAKDLPSLDVAAVASEQSAYKRVILPSQLLTQSERTEFETSSNSIRFLQSVREDGILWTSTNFLRHESMKTLPDLLPIDRIKKIPIISYCCSTGEEPYTLHLLLRTRFGADYYKRLPIQAFDLDQRALSTARLGEITCDLNNDRQLLAEMRKNSKFIKSLGLEFFVKNDDQKIHAKIPDFEKVTFERRDIRLDPLEFDSPVAIFIQNAIYHLKFEDQFALMDKLCTLPSGSLLYLGLDTITDRLFSEMLPKTGAFSTATTFTNVLSRR